MAWRPPLPAPSTGAVANNNTTRQSGYTSACTTFTRESSNTVTWHPPSPASGTDTVQQHKQQSRHGHDGRKSEPSHHLQSTSSDRLLC
jgi:hypothetical protein